MPFAALKLNEPIVKALTDAGYTMPTPIQAAAIPEILAGHDIMASAQTGTGKTAAFMLPALQKLSQPSSTAGKGPRVLVLTPTRELAMQVTDAAHKYGRNLPRFRAVSVVGGMPYQVQNRLLAAPMEVLVATPGRLMDQMDSGRINFSRLEMLVLDEADRMLDMGFIDDVEAIAAKLPQERQTLLFSATLEGKIAVLAKNLLNDPKRIQISSREAKHENITQRLIYVDDLDHKLELLEHLLSDVELKQAIVFTATKRDADDLAGRLVGQGQQAAALHGDMPQRQRNRTLDQLKRGRIRVLIATDVAARGIDVSTITHVINFDLPKFAEDYVHRIGRTGRAGQSGTAISLASEKEILLLKRIERFSGNPIEIMIVPGMEARFDPRKARHAPRKSSPGKRPASKRPHSSSGNGNSSTPRTFERRGQDGNRSARTDRSNGNRFSRD
ncbi:MAG TPA: DEAD/DEAH box helicase [Burkholderiales bacterium]|nr:DEAD/DEAH box helicase [Burkholderiales bacterium]